MQRPSKSVTSIGVVAFVIAAAVAGAAAIPGTAWSGFVHPLVLFVAVFVGILVLGIVLDRAARDASTRR